MLDTVLSVLTGKYEKIKSSLKSFFDVLDPKKATESSDRSLKKLGQLYAIEIPDILALNAELELFEII